MGDKKMITPISLAPSCREKYERVAKGVQEDMQAVRHALNGTLTPPWGKWLRSHLEKIEAGVVFLATGEEQGPLPEPAEGSVADRRRLRMYGILTAACDHLAAKLDAPAIAGQELDELVAMFGICAEEIRDYRAAVEIEAELRQATDNNGQ